MTETRYGLQPAYAHVLKQCGSTRVAADLLNVKATHLRRALNGVTPINDRVREGLPILLRLSAVELFTPQMLASHYGGSRGPTPGRKAELLASLENQSA